MKIQQFSFGVVTFSIPHGSIVGIFCSDFWGYKIEQQTASGESLISGLH